MMARMAWPISLVPPRINVEVPQRPAHHFELDRQAHRLSSSDKLGWWDHERIEISQSLEDGAGMDGVGQKRRRRLR